MLWLLWYRFGGCILHPPNLFLRFLEVTALSRLIKVISFLLIGVAIVLAVGMFYIYRVPVPSGIWVDVDDPTYMLEFNADGTYRESIFNMDRPYKVSPDGETLTIYTVGYDPVISKLYRNFGGHMILEVNGALREMRRADDKTSYKYNNTKPSGSPVAVYNLLASFDEKVSLSLFSLNIFELETGDDLITGKFYEKDKDELLLFYEDGLNQICDRLVYWDNGWALGDLESTLDVSVVKDNALTVGGYSLSGLVTDVDSDVLYSFSNNGVCSRSDAAGNTVEFLYDVDVSGLITLVDKTNTGVECWLWYDSSAGVVYRYVFSRDSWSEYLTSIGGVD